MRPRRLSPDDRALWDKVAATVHPLQGRRAPLPVRSEPVDELALQKNNPLRLTLEGKRSSQASNGADLMVRTKSGSTRHTLDGSWDKRLTKGAVMPDMTIDLHGETLATAHARLNRSLSAAVRAGARVILLITGKPAIDNPRLPPTSRGVIRASVHDWLAASAYASQIAAIRNAHPRHGGAGALYVILRRGR